MFFSMLASALIKLLGVGHKEDLLREVAGGPNRFTSSPRTDQQPLTLLLLQRYRNANGGCLAIHYKHPVLTLYD